MYFEINILIFSCRDLAHRQMSWQVVKVSQLHGDTAYTVLYAGRQLRSPGFLEHCVHVSRACQVMSPMKCSLFCCTHIILLLRLR